MKSTIKEINNREYPVLKICDTTVVLFIKENTGICVASDLECEELGEYSSDWDEKFFVLFGGTVELSN
jgi:hypothetical protein